jgi:hypothetical protein
VVGLLLPGLLALGLALASGGSVRNWSRTTVLGWPLVVGVFALELALYNPPVDREPWAMRIGPWLWLATRLLLLGVVLVNARRAAAGRWAWWIAACGLACNALAIAANDGHMPQSAVAAAAVWGPGHGPLESRLENVVLMTDQTRLAALGDILAEPAWLPRPNVVSPGDLLIAAGLAGWIFAISKPRAVPRGRDIVTGIGMPIHGVARPSRHASRS